MLIIGITGNIGTGKTTVAKIFKKLGAVVIDADEIAHALIEPSKPAWKKIKSFFGDSILNDDDTINRRALSKIVFADRCRLKRLCDIVHPLVYRDINSKLIEIKKAKPNAVVVLDAPLLIESGCRSKIDKLIVVSCRRDVQIKRTCKRFGIKRSQVLERLKAQMPLKDKIKLADFVIDNSGSPSRTERQAISVWKRLART